MKGSIAKCFSELVKTSFGEDKWKEILIQSGESPNMIVNAISDIDDQRFFKLIESACEVLNLSKQQAYDAFGDYFVNIYAPKLYGMYYKFRNAKEFILGMDNVHNSVTKMIPNAFPPRFKIDRVDEDTIIVNYKSPRNMIDLYIGLTKGVGKYFNTSIGIKKLSEESVELSFK